MTSEYDWPVFKNTVNVSVVTVTSPKWFAIMLQSAEWIMT